MLNLKCKIKISLLSKVYICMKKIQKVQLLHLTLAFIYKILNISLSFMNIIDFDYTRVLTEFKEKMKHFLFSANSVEQCGRLIKYNLP